MYVNDYWLGILSGFIGTFALMLVIALVMGRGKQ